MTNTKRTISATLAIVAWSPLAQAAGLPLTATDISAICRTVYAEAASEPLAGRVAVAAVILTRMGGDKSAAEVVNAPHQFEPVMHAGGDYRRLPLSAEQQVECRTIVELAVSGLLTDPSNGASHFQNRRIVAERAQRGQVRPSLVDFGGMPMVAEVGRHSFYRLGGPGAIPATATAARREIVPISRGAGHSMQSMFGENGDGREQDAAVADDAQSGPTEFVFNQDE